MTGWLLLPLVTGSIVYCVLIIVAARRYLSERDPHSYGVIPLSVLKPLAGADEGLEENLRSFFSQQYPDFELLFAVRRADDPAVAVVERLQAEYPAVPSRLLVVGEPPYPNAKVYSLDRMMEAAIHDVLVMSDSDIRVTPDMLQVVAAEFAAGADVATCPYRAVAGRSFWSQLEAIGMNTEFIGGVLVARLLEGMKFALGPTIIARRQVIEKIGGWSELSSYLAEDFVLGSRAAALGFKVILSSYVIEHRIGSQDLKHNFAHRLRWNRSTRRSRPAGYAGQLFTYPLPLAVALWVVRPDWALVSVAAIVVRLLAATFTGTHVLKTRVPPGRLMLQDVLSFFFWLAGFWGNTIVWRGRRYRLLPDGRFKPV